MTTTPKDSPSDLTSTSPPDGTTLFQSHEHLLNEEDEVDTLSSITNFVVASKLRPGMVIPCIASGVSGWTNSVWKGSYQISTTEPLFMKRVHFTVAYGGDLPANIRVDLTGMNGLLAFNEAGHSQWSPKLRGKLSKSIPFVPAGYESVAQPLTPPLTFCQHRARQAARLTPHE